MSRKSRLPINFDDKKRGIHNGTARERDRRIQKIYGGPSHFEGKLNVRVVLIKVIEGIVKSVLGALP